MVETTNELLSPGASDMLGDVAVAELSPSQLRVLGAIAAVGGRLLTKDELAGIAQCSKKTVDRAITRLSREGIIEVRARYDDNGSQLANEYLITAFSK